MTTGEKVEAVIFDLGGVLIDQPVKQIIRYCADYLQTGSDELMRAHRKYASEFQKGIITEREYWRRVCSEIDVLEPDVHSLWGEAFAFSYREHDEIFSLAARLRRSGYRTGLLSDTESPSMNYFLDRSYHHFDFLVFSCAEGAVKPEREIYRIALARAAAPPARTVFIDDMRSNVEAAEGMGIRGILYSEPERLLADLIGLGIVF